MATTVFKSLVDTTFDSVKGYEMAIEKADSPTLTETLKTQHDKRVQTLANLNNELQAQGDKLVTKGTTAGALHRTWTEVADLFEDSDEAASERIAEGEAYLAKKFEEALSSDQLEPNERAIVESSLSEIRQACRISKALERAYD